MEASFWALIPPILAITISHSDDDVRYNEQQSLQQYGRFVFYRLIGHDCSFNEYVGSNS